MTIGENVKARRKLLNLTQAQLAEMVGISNAFLSEVERGKKRPSYKVLPALASALQCTEMELSFGGEVQINESNKSKNLNIADGARALKEDAYYCITFKYSEGNRTAEVILPKDIDPSLLKIAIGEAAESVKGAAMDVSAVERVVKPASGGDV
jgi:transcriptional regulator with XRE-family HTH domain